MHLREHLSEAELPTDLDSDEKLLTDLGTAAKISLQRKANNKFHYVFNHPRFEHTVWGAVEHKMLSEFSEADLRRSVLRDVAQRYLAHLSSDVRTARLARAPLGSTVWFHGRLLKRSSNRLTPADVAFNLELPVLKHVPVELLMKMRRDEGDAFQRFRDSLRRGITERLRGVEQLKMISLPRKSVVI